MTVPINSAQSHWSVHTHSRYSANDALPSVDALVERAVELGYPALGLTDHGTMSGAVELYKACRKAGIEPLPGIELYVTPDHDHRIQANDHMTVLAYSETGYRNLVTLNNLAQSNFRYKPRLDFADLAMLADAGRLTGLAVGTGCYFGTVQQALIHHGPRAAAQIIKALDGWFPRVLIELHVHGVPDGHNDARYGEHDLMLELLALSDELGVPYVLADDAHYTHDDHQHLHDGLKELVAFGDDPSEARFPGGPYSLKDRAHYARVLSDYPDVVAGSCATLAALAAKASVRIPELDVFTAKMPDVTSTGDADAELRSLVMSAAVERGVVHDQIEHELEVMRRIGAAGYILLVAWVCQFMRDKGIWFHTRGSASGSLVCYLLNITQVDPVRGGLRFDRFMSADRISMPDIDLDVEHVRRDEVIAALEERFSVRQVGSHMQLGLTGDDSDEDGSKGSLLIKYWSKAGKLNQHHAAGARTWREVPGADQTLLRKLGALKLISGPGTHAAGYIVAPDEASVAELPLTWMAGRGAMVTSYGKKAVEALGFVKLDLLGLKTRTAIRLACEAIFPEDPMGFWESIPLKDKETFARIGKGETEGVFQLEGAAFTYGCRDMKPKSLADIIAAQALFRPASTSAKVHTRFLARRAGAEKAPEHHTDITAETKATYGLPLYQEQVMGVCRRMGMSSLELTKLLDAVKASNDNVEAARVYLDSINGRVRELAEARGWTESDIEWLFAALKGYADYGFNLAHAASYGLVSWRTAYLATNHRLQWWWAMLVAFQGAKRGKKDLESHYVRCARKYGVVVLGAHVNHSGATYTIDGAKLRKGLVALKGVGPVAAAELALHAPYTSLADLGERVTARKVSGAKGLALKKPPVECGGVVAALFDQGALDGLT